MFWRMGNRVQPLGERIQQLPSPGGLDRERGSHQTQTRRSRSKHGLRAKGSDHFVVAHINEPQIALMPRALSCNGQDRV